MPPTSSLEFRSRLRPHLASTASPLAGVGVVGLLLSGLLGSGCLSMQQQLQPTDMAVVEQAQSREERELMYEQERIRVSYDPRGKRFVKGDDPYDPVQGWQSLDAVVRSDANSSAVLPERKLRTSKILFGVAIASSLVMLAGAAATAREGLDTNSLAGPGAVLLAGSGMTLGFGIGAGITFQQARHGYEDAVEVYNDSLGLRLGLYDGEGNFIPPPGTLLDEEGFIVLEDSLPLASANPALLRAGAADPADEAALAGASLHEGSVEGLSDPHLMPSQGDSAPVALNLVSRGLTSAPTE